MGSSKDVRPTRSGRRTGAARRGAAFTLGLLLAACAGDEPAPSGATACGKDTVCRSTFGISVKRAEPGWTQGIHEVTISIDGAETHCQYAWPPRSPVALVVASCAGNRGGSVQVDLRERTGCPAGAMGCTPAPGHFSEEIGIVGTPGEVEITRRLDGEVQGSRAFYPIYQDRTATAGACSAVCQNASVDWTL